MATPATHRAAAPAAMSARAGRALDPIERQAAIENALSMALYFMRRPGDTPAEAAANLWAATARTNRALTLLKAAAGAHLCTQGRA
ncbi:MAG: hypothetical protein Q4F13_09655 [Pseudomonadota bacterium]|nr:hypothetical protein [Pseudomonadota bacterium]